MSKPPQPGRAKPTTKATVLRRIDQVLQIRLAGAEFWDVRQYVRDQEAVAGSDWEVPAGLAPMADSTVYSYIKRADKLIVESHERSRKKLLRRHLAQRRHLYARAVAAGDFRTALTVLRDEALLIGLYPNGEDQIRKEIARLKEDLDKLVGLEGGVAGDQGPHRGDPPAA